jgi:hypothetical protein
VNAQHSMVCNSKEMATATVNVISFGLHAFVVTSISLAVLLRGYVYSFLA